MTLGKRYDGLQPLNDGRNFYDYEKEFIKLWEDLGREVFETASIIKLAA